MTDQYFQTPDWHWSADLVGQLLPRRSVWTDWEEATNNRADYTRFNTWDIGCWPMDANGGVPSNHDFTLYAEDVDGFSQNEPMGRVTPITQWHAGVHTLALGSDGGAINNDINNVTYTVLWGEPGDGCCITRAPSSAPSAAPSRSQPTILPPTAAPTTGSDHPCWSTERMSISINRFQAAPGTSLSGSVSTILTALSWICAGICMCGALPSPVCALNWPISC